MAAHSKIPPLPSLGLHCQPMEESNSGSGDPSDRLTLSGDAGMKRTGSATALPRQIHPIARARIIGVIIGVSVEWRLVLLGLERPHFDQMHRRVGGVLEQGHAQKTRLGHGELVAVAVLGGGGLIG